ncbi:LLM class flavin-dependent oxidoreductase [Brachybacterium saurashtrense]|uniref:LLM class flavin-dependent oxidoreductase n=1 Tax=Brachybacterium saurashtrense TaxID=556288 RepID=A0A345YQ53_9MICO|nr:LLM class flavin-dependent oxidoreductase [Brachybacterium saurashtrense]AXK46055.1 LLM class flavin-dependent oxidoreductase [Brachybacterium saurashtrense]RRR23795.1 LLM class flavin-dependent oxidoreductase [Brachybacterium saurashtrense]
MTLLTGFSSAPTWMRGPAWRRSDSRVEELFSGAPILEAIQLAEHAGFDVAFRPDALTLPLASVGGDPAQLGLDPIVQTARLALATERITLVPTVSATFTEPYPLARQLVSLEHLAPGRIGWNVVTSRSGDEQFSVSRLPDSASRWRRAEELVDAVESLRAGFPASAMVCDRDSGRLVALDRVRPSDHVGANFRVAGPLPLPVPTAGATAAPHRLPLFVAGGGAPTISFAGRRAEAMFAAAVSAETGTALRSALHREAAAAARPEPPRLLPGLSLLLADTRAQAAEIAHTLAIGAPGRPPGGPHWSVIGTAEDAARAISARAAEGTIDGFIAFPIGSWRSAELVCTALMPLLRDLGLLPDLPDPAPFRSRQEPHP